MDYSLLYSFILIIASFQGSELPESTPAIEKLIVQLGDKRFKVRENAQKELVNHKRNAVKACLLGQKNPDFEIANRCKQISEQYFTIPCAYGKNLPSIYLLDNKHRYPFGVEYEMDPYGSNYYCQNFFTVLDVSVFYFEKAKAIYNNGLTQEAIKFGFRINSWSYRDGALEEMAMRLYLQDLLYYGKSHEEINKIIADTEGKINLYFHRPYSATPPGPAVPFKQED